MKDFKGIKKEITDRNPHVSPLPATEAEENCGVTISIYSQEEDELQRVGGQLGIVLCLFVSKLSIN